MKIIIFLLKKLTILFDNKRMQSTDSRETYAYRTSKYLVIKKEEIRPNSLIKQYKKRSTLMMIQKKT